MNRAWKTNVGAERRFPLDAAGGRQVSGSVTGNKNGAKDNLRAESFGDFATHLATVAARWEYANVS